MQAAMANATKVMAKTNKMMNPQKVAKKAQKFQIQQQKNELAQVSLLNICVLVKLLLRK